MRLSKHKRPTIARLNMTPMIDIVFLLLVFFMTVTQLSEIQRERLELPQQIGSQEQQRTALIVNINRAGEIKVAGETFSSLEFVALIGRELTAVGGDATRLSVVIRADQLGNSEIVNEVMQSLERMDVKRVRIAVESPAG